MKPQKSKILPSFPDAISFRSTPLNAQTPLPLRRLPRHRQFPNRHAHLRRTYWFCEKFLDPRSPRAEQMLIATPTSLQLSSCTAYPEWIGTVEL